ncbi:kinase-like domain-containing protein [Terfezia claveryi]|nr:kinase-like domain-containing protein [Terfezia claveryi]
MSNTIENHLFSGCRPVKVISEGTNSQVSKVEFAGSLIAVKRCSLKHLREIFILRHLQGHPNVVHSFAFDVWDNFLYIYQEYVSSDLSQVIAADRAKIQVRIIMYQLLCGVRWIHSAGIIHRDIKPSNILVQDGQVKICDFGSAHESSSIGTEFYVVSGWYRAPELLLCQTYGFAVDIWAVGCVWSEILLGHPLFHGVTTEGQLQCIVQTLEFGKTKSSLKEVLGSDYCEDINDAVQFHKVNRPTANELLQRERFQDLANTLHTNTQECYQFNIKVVNVEQVLGYTVTLNSYSVVTEIIISNRILYTGRR